LVADRGQSSPPRWQGRGWHVDRRGCGRRKSPDVSPMSPGTRPVTATSIYFSGWH